MAGIPKLSPEQWAKVRSHWEMDDREGFAWLIQAMDLPVSGNAVRKRAISEGWAKVTDGEPSGKPSLSNDCGQSGGNARTLGEPSMSAANHPTTIDEANAREVTPFKTRETPTLDQLDIDEPRQGLFVREYVKDLNGTQAVIRAGYSTERADVQASRLLCDSRVQTAIRELRDELLSRLEAKAEDVLRTLVYQLHADVNELSQFRRVCCRSCWGTDHQRQYTPLEYQDAKLAHDKERAKILDKSDGEVDIGEFPSYEHDWYDRRREPNANCPECFGEGLGEVYFGDTRKLSKGARALYNGVKQGKHGVEILIANRERVIEQLAKVLGMFREQETYNTASQATIEELTAMFNARIKDARERQKKILEERGLSCKGEDAEA